jgi:hypothetical protein
LEQRTAAAHDVEQRMKICLFLLLMSIFVGASYLTTRRDAKARPGSAQPGGSTMPRG